MKTRPDTRYSALLELRAMRTANRMARKLGVRLPWPCAKRRAHIQRTCNFHP
jgi:hypothetical protein